MCRTKVNLREGFSETQKKIALSKTNRRCAHCGKPLDLYNMTVDHCIPLSKGGLNKETNLVALCEDCNKEKSNSLYKPSDYYKYITPYQLASLDKAFYEYMEQNEWFDIQTFFPMDHYAIPNYTPLLKYANDLTPKGLSSFFKLNATKASKCGEYHFKRARFKHIYDLVEYIDTVSPNYFTTSENNETTYDWIEHYLKNGAIFTLTKGDSKEITAVFIFSLECILVKEEVTFGLNIKTVSQMGNRAFYLLYAYIESLVVKGIFEENQFTHLIISNECSYKSPYFKNGLFEVTSNSANNQITFYRCMTLDKKGRLISGIIQDRNIPDTLKKGTHYYQRFFELSDVTEEQIKDSLKTHNELVDELECKDHLPDVFSLGILDKRRVREN